MAKKAYACEEPVCGYQFIHFFETREQAKDWFAGEYGMRYIDVRPFRVPWADKYEHEDNIPVEAYFENGWWFECNTCGGHIHEMEDFFVNERGYCCKACYKR